MAYVALKKLTWANDYLLPGDPVPEGEDGRDYDLMVRMGEIAEIKDEDEIKAAKAAPKSKPQAESKHKEPEKKTSAAKAESEHRIPGRHSGAK